MDYELFGDYFAFDSTYKTNRYISFWLCCYCSVLDLIKFLFFFLIFILFFANRYGKPFILLLVSNNHNGTCVLGFALLQNELAETYTWVLEKIYVIFFLKKIYDSIPYYAFQVRKILIPFYSLICILNINYSYLKYKKKLYLKNT